MKHYTFANAAVRLAGGKAVREFFEPIFLDRDNELLVVALCADDLRLIHLLGVPGTEHSIQIRLADILKGAIQTECAAIILAHNHPSNDTRPSNADRELTRRLSLIAEAMDITFLEHLIFNHGPVFSFRERGLL